MAANTRPSGGKARALHERIAPVIRRAEACDAPLLSELGTRTFFETFEKDNTPEDMALYLASAFSPELQAAELSDPLTVAFLAEHEGAPAGYALLHAGPVPACVTGKSPVELVRLYVLQSLIGRGVGEALMRTCLDEATGLAYGTIWLGVWERNLRAQTFYRRWSFHHVGEHVFQVGTDPQIDWLLQKELDPR